MGDYVLGEEMPRKKERGPDVVTAILYVIVGIIILKILRVIPDPPEYDVNVVIGLLSLTIAILTGFSNWLSRRFSHVDDTLDDLSKKVQAISTNLKMVEQKLSFVESSLNFQERLVKLEERLKEKK